MVVNASAGGGARLLPDLFAAPVDTRSLEEKKRAPEKVDPANPPPAETPEPAPLTPIGRVAFALPQLETAIQDQQGLQQTRQAVETEVLKTNLQLSEKAAKDSAGVLDSSQAASEEIRRQQLDILGGIQGQISIANEAIALSDSKNPLDRYKLWMLQQTNLLRIP
jgi:hypothetical protein